MGAGVVLLIDPTHLIAVEMGPGDVVYVPTRWLVLSEESQRAATYDSLGHPDIKLGADGRRYWRTVSRDEIKRIIE